MFMVTLGGGPATAYIHNTSREEFQKWADLTGAEINQLSDSRSIHFKIKNVDIVLFSKDGKGDANAKD